MNSELSKTIGLADVPQGGYEVEIDANPTERDRIAKRLKVQAVNRLKGWIEVRPTAVGADVDGRFEAELIRICVASLEEMSETISDSFSISFTTETMEQSGEEDLEGLEAPEFLAQKELDLGDILIQQLALGMAQYPRKPGVVSLNEKYGESPEQSPFAVLAGKLGENDG